MNRRNGQIAVLVAAVACLATATVVAIPRPMLKPRPKSLQSRPRTLFFKSYKPKSVTRSALEKHLVRYGPEGSVLDSPGLDGKVYVVGTAPQIREINALVKGVDPRAVSETIDKLTVMEHRRESAFEK